MHRIHLALATLLATSLQAAPPRKTTRPTKPKAAVPAPAAQAPEAPAPAPQPAPLPKPRVRLETSYGPILLELEPEAAPETVANFLRYVSEGQYEGTIFHRVIRGFMIQGGGMTETMQEKPTRPAVLNESKRTFQAGLRNTAGTVAMARLDSPHSATCQFYINTADNPTLDPQGQNAYGYTVFGRVVEGMDAVRRIEGTRTIWRAGQSNVPDIPVRIRKAAVLPQAGPAPGAGSSPEPASAPGPEPKPRP